MSESATMSAGGLVAGLVVIAFYSASLLLWIRAFYHYGRRALESLVPLRAREQPFWNPSLFLLVFGGYFFFVSLLATITADYPSLQTMSAQLTLNTLAGVFTIGVSIHLISARFPRAIEQLGLQPRIKDVGLGLIATVMILPPTMVISGLASNLVKYHHPVLDSLKAEPDFGFFVVMLFGTAIVTPLVEEFLFRVLLQGGMQSVADRVSLLGMNPYAVSSFEDSTVSVDRGEFRPTSWWPIMVTSLIFAALHLGQGAAPIPLFFLSLGLGFLYRQTGNITASFVVHALLNFMTLAVNFAELKA